MHFIDTHSHLYLEEFNKDRAEIISRALGAGVSKILLPNIDKGSVQALLEMVYDYPGICYPMIGIHPTSVKKDYLHLLEFVKEWLSKEKFIAIGEIGIDLYWDKSFFKQQSDIFKSQLNLALEMNKPVVIHSRESFPEIFKLLEDYRGSGLEGVFHAFTGDTGEAEFITEFGFKIGIGGIVTFKNSGLANVVADIGVENLLLETDAPYLAPSPYRGKRNESAYIPIIAEKVAEITGLDSREVADITTQNALDLFKLNN